METEKITKVKAFKFFILTSWNYEPQFPLRRFMTQFQYGKISNLVNNFILESSGLYRTVQCIKTVTGFLTLHRSGVGLKYEFMSIKVWSNKYSLHPDMSYSTLCHKIHSLKTFKEWAFTQKTSKIFMKITALWEVMACILVDHTT